MIANNMFRKPNKKDKNVDRMVFRKNKKRCLIYPEDKFKQFWDLLMTLILLIACFTTPLDIAFEQEVSTSILDNPVSLAIDLMFVLDILIIFNTAFYDSEMDIVDSRRKIAAEYFRGWFFIDFMAVVPFDIILNASQFNSLARVVRVGRLYKLVKLSKLFRFMKVWKNKNKILKQLTEFLRIGLGFERLFFFILIFFIGIHLSACFWLITASMLGTNDDGSEEINSYHGTWLEKFEQN